MLISRTIFLLTELVIGLVEVTIGMRVLLKLLGASTAAPFVAWVYQISQPLLKPFEGMFPSERLTGGFVIEFSALFALLIYGVLGYLIEEVILHFRRSSSKLR